MHPPLYLAEWFRSQRNQDFATLFATFNQSGSFKEVRVIGHGMESGVERLCGI
jgi:hypothetical protein